MPRTGAVGDAAIIGHADHADIGFAEGLGFAGVLAGPLVRSSYRAGRLYQQASAARSGARTDA